MVMSEKDQFDDLLRQRFQKKTFEFDERHWLQAEKMIVAKERKDKTRILAFLIFGFGILVLAAIFYWFTLPGTLDQKEFNNWDSQKSQKETASKKAEHQQKWVESKSNETDILPGNSLHNDIKSIEKANKSSSRSTQRTIAVTDGFVSAIENIQEGELSTLQVDPLATVSVRILQTDIVDLPLRVSGLLLNNADILKQHSTEKQIQDIVPFIKKIKQQRLGLFCYAGVFAGKGFSNTSGDTGIGFNPLAGAGIEYRITPTWGLSAGLNYFEKNKVNSDKIFHSEYYAGEFGKRSEDIRIDVIKLHYLQVPMMLHFHLSDPEKQVQVGLSYNHLLTSLSNVTTSSQVTGEALIANSKQEYGYINGFKNQDIAILLGFAYPLGNHLQGVIHIQYGLEDITKNTYYENTALDKNIGIQAFIKYQF